MAAELALEISRFALIFAIAWANLRIVVLFCDCFSEQSSEMASLGWWGMDMTTTAGGL